ncbi:MAG: 3-hydroxyisobutyrate dehydrogenase [Xanthomonadales bacterium]|nr:3-hydroxyisobutyrate dehydrogenase [Xanthomonadales bacterium]
MSSIAFIGLGNMGGPMAANLVSAGHSVRAFDLSEAACAVAKQAGCTVATSAAEAAGGADIVFSMLPSGAVVEAVYLGDDGLLASLPSTTLVIDSSTIAAESARTVWAAADALGIRMIDAPVSGGVAAATAGTLTFICGGREADIDAARPVLEAMGKNVLRAGDSGAGQVAKICNNMLLAVHMIGTAEALALGDAHGVDPAVLSEIMLASSGRNWSLEVYNPWPGVMENAPASKEYQGGFMVDLMHKDLGLALAAAQAEGASTPMGALARSLYALPRQAGNGRLDFSSIQSMLRES